MNSHRAIFTRTHATADLSPTGFPHPAPRTSASLVCSSTARKRRSRLRLALPLLAALLGLHCTALTEQRRPDPTPAVAASRDAVATGRSTADEATTAFVQQRAAERTALLQAWIDALERTVHALEHAVPRTRAPQAGHREAAADAIAPAQQAARAVAQAPWRPDDPDLNTALEHAALALRAAEDLLSLAFDGQAEPADRAWEAVVHHFNAWRDALEHSVTRGPLGAALSPARHRAEGAPPEEDPSQPVPPPPDAGD